LQSHYTHLRSHPRTNSGNVAATCSGNKAATSSGNIAATNSGNVARTSSQSRPHSMCFIPVCSMLFCQLPG
ncbi:hypothetical protein DPMN_171476, partial [Dreissena polymorpha]